MAKFRTLLSTNKSMSEEHNIEDVIGNNFRDVQDNVNTVYGRMRPEGESGDDETERAVVWVIAVFAILTPIIMGIVCIWQSKREKVLVRTALVQKGEEKKQKKHPKETHGGH
eukprot:849489_1